MKILLYVVALISFNSFSQEVPVLVQIPAKPAPVTISRHQLGISFSADRTKRHRFRKASGFSAGVNYTLRTKDNRIRFDFGILFSQIAYHSYDKKVTFNETDDTLMSFYDRATFIEIPLKVNFFFLQKEKVSLYATTGICPGNFINTRRTASYFSQNTGNKLYEDPETEVKPTYHFLPGTCFGLGLEYRIIPSLSLTLQPEIRTKATPEILGSEIYSSMGLNFGLRMNL